MGQLLGVRHTGYVRCPLHVVCGWQTVDRTHLGTVVVVRGVQSSGLPRMVSVDATEHVNSLLRDHLTSHRELLRELLDAAVAG
jgi:hypothetical protein